MNDLFHSIYIDNGAKKTLALLHGTGGDEYDLLPLVHELEHSYNFLGIRGNVQQIGMNRFFKRNLDGSFDLDSIKEETAKLAAFLQDHPADAFVGYSNGANMILAMTFSYSDLISTAVLLHPKLPFTPEPTDLSGKKFLVSYGEHDQMITMTESKEAIKTLEEFGATVETDSHQGGHELHRNEVEELLQFLI